MTVFSFGHFSCSITITHLTELYTPVIQNVMAVLQSELQNLRTQFEESLNSHEDDKKSLSEQFREFNQQKEHAHQEVRSFKRFMPIHCHHNIVYNNACCKDDS